jgi:hypothetical protein
MSFEIRTPDGRILAVHTEVGTGPARVIVEERQPDPVPMEGSDE